MMAPARRTRRTRLQNELLALRAIDSLAAGRTMKEIAWDLRGQVRYETLRKHMTRYRRRMGFRTTMQMVAARAVAQAKEVHGEGR